MKQGKNNIYLSALNAAYSSIGNNLQSYIVGVDSFEKPKDRLVVLLSEIGKYDSISKVNVHEMTSLLRSWCTNHAKPIYLVAKMVDSKVIFAVAVTTNSVDTAYKISNEAEWGVILLAKALDFFDS